MGRKNERQEKTRQDRGTRTGTGTHTHHTRVARIICIHPIRSFSFSFALCLCCLALFAPIIFLSPSSSSSRIHSRNHSSFLPLFLPLFLLVLLHLPFGKRSVCTAHAGSTRLIAWPSPSQAPALHRLHPPLPSPLLLHTSPFPFLCSITLPLLQSSICLGSSCQIGQEKEYNRATTHTG